MPVVNGSAANSFAAPPSPSHVLVDQKTILALLYQIQSSQAHPATNTAHATLPTFPPSPYAIPTLPSTQFHPNTATLPTVSQPMLNDLLAINYYSNMCRNMEPRPKPETIQPAPAIFQTPLIVSENFKHRYDFYFRHCHSPNSKSLNCHHVLIRRRGALESGHRATRLSRPSPVRHPNLNSSNFSRVLLKKVNSASITFSYSCVLAPAPLTPQDRSNSSDDEPLIDVEQLDPETVSTEEGIGYDRIEVFPLPCSRGDRIEVFSLPSSRNRIMLVPEHVLLNRLENILIEEIEAS